MKRRSLSKEYAELFAPITGQQSVTNDVELGSFEAGLRLDENDLNIEIVQQPGMFQKVADRYALAKSQRDQAKDDLKTVEAQTSLDIRREKADKGEKTTEAELGQLVQVSPERRAAFRRYINAEQLAAQLEGLVESWRSRGWMIKELCNLKTSAYDQQSSVSSPTADYRNQQYDSNRAKLATGREERRNRK
jgi:hypothetical protein